MGRTKGQGHFGEPLTITIKLRVTKEFLDILDAAARESIGWSNDRSKLIRKYTKEGLLRSVRSWDLVERIQKEL